MAEGADKDDKTEEPTAKRLEDARSQGDIIYSTEATAFLMLAAVTALLMSAAAPTAAQLSHLAELLLVTAADRAVDPASLMRMMAEIGLRLASALGLAFLLLMSVGIAGRYLQDKPVISAARMKPKLDHLNPIQGFERVFGEVAVANFVKGILKLVIVGAAVLWALWPRDGTLEVMAFLDPAAFFAVVQERAGALMMACLIAVFLVAAVDYVYQREQFMKRQRMSREEIKREFRENEGDPMLKAKLRQIRMDRTRLRMIQNVQNATVVVTNPTHYAIALKYDRETTPAPICLAKGVDEVALKIREAAEEHNIPLIEDPPLARALFASAELGEPIPRQHYEAVAKIISLVLRLAKRRRPVPSRANRPQ